jgi:hypothetical protein
MPPSLICGRNCVEIQVLESAKEDLREGTRFYEAMSPGLGDYFLDCIQDDVRSLTLFAGIHEVAGEFHRLLVKRFPFAVYYLVDNDRVDVYAILD